MGYQVKWVIDNLGVSRKALRIYEEKGLMPKNENSQYRNYTEEDIDHIWTIKVFQGMGYSLDEIVALSNLKDDTEFDFCTSITQKVTELETKKADIERHLGYAKMIQLTGRFPSRPRDMGSVKFDDFYENALEEWNTQKNPAIEVAQSAINQLLETPEEAWNETELGSLISTLSDLGMDKDAFEATLQIDALLKFIIARSQQGPNDAEVQLLVKILYETVHGHLDGDYVTPQQFGRLYSSGFMEGQIGKQSRAKYGADACSFLADAIAIFGGYKCYEDIP